MGKPREEIELKFAVADVKALRARIARLGFRVAKPRRREANWIFDDARGTLRTGGRLLRLRHSGADWVLTVKGQRVPGPLKRRREDETAVSDGEACRRILAALGFHETLRYDRHRTTYEQPHTRGELALDQTPMGWFLEIEGSDGWVRRTAAALGWRIEAAEPRSYPALYAAFRLQTGR